jgi:hypothetical protein
MAELACRVFVTFAAFCSRFFVLLSSPLLLGSVNSRPDVSVGSSFCAAIGNACRCTPDEALFGPGNPRLKPLPVARHPAGGLINSFLANVSYRSQARELHLHKRT